MFHHVKSDIVVVEIVVRQVVSKFRVAAGQEHKVTKVKHWRRNQPAPRSVLSVEQALNDRVIANDDDVGTIGGRFHVTTGKVYAEVKAVNNEAIHGWLRPTTEGFYDTALTSDGGMNYEQVYHPNEA